MSRIRAFARLATALFFALPVAAIQAYIAGPIFKNYETLPRLVHSGVRDIMGIRVDFNNVANPPKPVIYAANHMSYMDIVLLGSVLKGSFVSKKEVRKWPFVGRAANSIKTIFIERTHEAVPEAQGEVAKTLNQGQSVIMFPESTTGRGDELLPFKRGLLSIAFNNISGVPLNKDALVQPVSLRVTHVDGKDVSTDPSLRRKYSWVGEESILRHIWEMASLESIRVEITAHEPVDPKKFQDKASFVSEIERIVRAGTKGLSPQAT